MAIRGNKTNVTRYWPGKAPEWADYNNAEGGNDIPMANHDVVTGKDEDDPRLSRLARVRTDINRDEVRENHRRIRQAAIVVVVVPKAEDESKKKQEGWDLEVEDEDVLEKRRRKIREKQLQRQKQEEEEASLPPMEEEKLVEEEECEYETDWEEEEEEEIISISMAKPNFVPISERDTVVDRERLEAEELALEEAAAKKRKKETKEIVVEKIREDLEIHKNITELEAIAADVDTDDDVNEVEEYEAWKAREIAKIKRDGEEREAMAKAKEEVEKVRNTTEGEKGNLKPARQCKRKRRFMQKDYHPGAFFQSGTAGADSIYSRDFCDPTGEDKMDKTMLPKVMQVKNFGRRGRTKWTHLVNEDTTDWNTPWTYSDLLRPNYHKKMAGMNAPIARPKGSKRMKGWDFLD